MPVEAAGGGVAVVDNRHLQQLLGDGGRDDAGTAGGGDEAHPHGAALAGHLTGHGVRQADLVAPEAAPHGHDGELGEDDRAADGGGHLLGALYAIFPCLLLNNCSSLNCTALRDILPFFAGGSILLLSSVSFSECEDVARIRRRGGAGGSRGGAEGSRDPDVPAPTNSE